ncbi:hypothetical protein A6A29_10970 [Streptomyces sp. TSRI0281]|nr:hypothetical protein A6A29_10970 [Streptomyces sp. TSRI0281]
MSPYQDRLSLPQIDRTCVWLERVIRDRPRKTDEELDRYRLAFDRLRAQAWDMAASSAVIERVRKEI